jgi:diacylglycerol kinase family enzyme
MGGLLLINPRAGEGRLSTRELEEAARALGIRTHVLAPDDDAAELARGAQAETLGIAGGDGSLGAVAAAALERDVPFVCVPAGTRNHFARDLGLDRSDPLGALAAFGGGRERRVDVGRVNGRVFLNNVSLGLYAGLVHRREHHRRRGEALASLRALWRSAGTPHRLRIRVDGEELAARVLLVANNDYEVAGFDVGARPRLDRGRLHLYAADGWLPLTWAERTGPRFRLEYEADDVAAAADGEPLVLEPPLEFELVPRALRVLLPPQAEDLDV